MEIELERDFAQLETTTQDHVKLADLDEMIEVAMSKWEVEALAREDFFRELKAVCRLQRRTRAWLYRAKIRVEQEQQWFTYFREFDEDIHGKHTGIFDYDRCVGGWLRAEPGKIPVFLIRMYCGKVSHTIFNCTVSRPCWPTRTRRS